MLEHGVTYIPVLPANRPLDVIWGTSEEGGIMHYEELEQVSTLRFLHVGPYQPHCLYTGEDGVVIIKLCTTLLRSAAEPCWSDA